MKRTTMLRCQFNTTGSTRQTPRSVVRRLTEVIQWNNTNYSL